MLKNHTYDLMETASVLSKGLHRYDRFRKDAGTRRSSGASSTISRSTFRTS